MAPCRRVAEVSSAVKTNIWLCTMVWRSAAVVRRSKSGSRVWLVKESMFKGSRLLGASDGAPTSVYPQPTNDPISIPSVRSTHVSWRIRPKPSTMRGSLRRSHVRRLRVWHRTICPLSSAAVSLCVTQVYGNRKRYSQTEVSQRGCWFCWESV